MTETTVVAVYETAAAATAAVAELEAAKVPSGAISRHAKTDAMPHAARAETSAPGQDKGFWSSLFDIGSDHDTTVYDRSVEAGATVVTVKVPEQHLDQVSAILERHDPLDLDERGAGYASAAETTTERTTAEDSSIALAEERLSVGKRAVSGGTTRIRRYVVETPVEEQIALRSEKVTLERRPVSDGRPVGTADFTDRMVEMTETSEEAVVAKTARVTEEVRLRKDASDRVETVKDTVRRDEVEIEQVPASTERTGGTAPDLAPARSKPNI